MSVGKILIRHLPTVLAVTSLATGAAATVSAVYDTMNGGADAIVDIQEELGELEDPTTGEKLKIIFGGIPNVGKNYWRTGALEAVSLVTGIAGHKSCLAQIGGLTAALAASGANFSKYRTEVAKRIGPKNEEEIAMAVSCDLPELYSLIDESNGDDVFLDWDSGRVFTSTLQHVRDAAVDFQEFLRSNATDDDTDEQLMIEVNDWYHDWLEIDSVPNMDGHVWYCGQDWHLDIKKAKMTISNKAYEVYVIQTRAFMGVTDDWYGDWYGYYECPGDVVETI